MLLAKNSQRTSILFYHQKPNLPKISQPDGFTLGLSYRNNIQGGHQSVYPSPKGPATTGVYIRFDSASLVGYT